MFFKNAHYLLANMTEAEKMLEPAIAALGCRYRCQLLFPGLKHIADFALLDHKVIIELDGNSHNAPLQKKKDLEHMLKLQAQGWNVVRFKNETAMANPAETVEAALRAPQTPPETYQAALEALRAEHPHLWEIKPRKRRQRKSRKPSKTAARASRKR